MYNYQNNYIPRNDSRILIAEDDPAHAEAMRRALETAHWTNIEVVENLQQFRARSIALPPTIALVDLNLPDGRANDLLLQRTTEDKFPLIVITNTNDIKTVIDVMKAGAFDYLIKSPDTFNELPRRLLHILTQWEILQQRTEFSNEINMIYKLSLDMICIARFNGYFHRVNPAFERTLGYSSTLLCSKPFIEFVHPDDRAATERAFSDLINGGASKFINRFRASSGEFYWFEWNASIAPTKDTVYAVARDITERRNSETLLMQYKTALDTTHDGFMTFDAHGCLLETNGAFSALMGYRAEALRGMRFEEIEKQEPMDGRAGKHIEDVIERGWSLFETELRHSDGHAIEVEISASFIPDTQKIVAFCRDISSRKAAEKKIEHLAFYDPLTDLPNRSLLLDRLQKSLRSFTRSRSGGALLFIDLDDFKMLNDTLGHDMGDLLLKMVAERLTTCVRTGDTVARMGGDEFVVMLTDLSQTPMKAAAQTTSIVTKIIQTLNVEYPLASRLYRITPSIGATVFSHEFSAEEHMKQADIAMYQAKKQGKNTFCFFDPAMQAKINARALLESDLRIAVEKNQFQLYFQTQVDRYLRPLGAEVLVRWIHPEHGVVPPSKFIQLAEETGLILPIGQWVIEMACAQIKSWQRNALTRHLTLSVNVSAKQFHESRFVEQVSAAVKRHSVNPMLLKLEPTESVLLENIEKTISTMRGLKAVGVSFALDDFGTGYSSLQYLKKLPLTQLKIDQSFVRDLVLDTNDQAIVRTIIAMAKVLNLEVIAEGVETQMQKDILQNQGCDLYQGYLFGMPLPVKEFEKNLKRA